MFALITTLSTNLLRTYIIYRFMRLFFWTDIEEKKKERADCHTATVRFFLNINVDVAANVWIDGKLHGTNHAVAHRLTEIELLSKYGNPDVGAGTRHIQCR